MPYNFKQSIERIQSILKDIKNRKIDPAKKIDSVKSLYNFKESESSCYAKSLQTAFNQLKANSLKLAELAQLDINNTEKIRRISDLIYELKINDISKLEEDIEKVSLLYSQLSLPKEKPIEKASFKLSYIPEDVKPDVSADLRELEKCFANECFRSAIIICGRLLETALHRRYYEETGQDLLEKSPGVGLGSIIAKLKEKNINIDPAIMQQIHLVNEVRVFSVHRKKEAFYPTKTQTHAMVLYTLDVLEKIFKK